MKDIALHGTITALVTPFNPDGSVDFQAYDKLIDYQIVNGVEGLVACGSTGESATLTNKEKQALIIHTIEYVAGRIPVIAGTGTNETQATMDMTLFAAEHGADAALIVTPYYNKPTQDGLFEHYRLVADNVDLPVILYNVPGRTGVNLLPETQIKLAEKCPNIIATKEASGDIEQMMEIIRNAPKNFTLLSGDDVLTLPVISIGGKGIISVLSNYAPKKFSDCVRLALAGNYNEALKLHYELFELMSLNFVESNPIPVKTALALMGMIEEVYRLPMMPIKPENKKKIKAALSKAGLLK